MVLKQYHLYYIHLGITLTKYVQDLYEENDKNSDNKIRKLNKWRDIPCSWTGRLNIVKMSVWGTSLAVQWLKVHLAMQGTQVRSLVGRMPHTVGQPSLSITTTEVHAPRACALQQEKPIATRSPRLQLETFSNDESGPHLAQL